MPIILNGLTSGSTTLQATDAVTQTITLPNNSGTVLTSASTQSAFPPNIAGNGPAFSAYYVGTGQNISLNTSTKVILNTKDFDTASCFDTSTYRFTPNIAGYYQFNAQIRASGVATYLSTYLYKNGSALIQSEFLKDSSGYVGTTISGLIYLNGSTDYVELYAISDGNPATLRNDSIPYVSRLSGFLARSA